MKDTVNACLDDIIHKFQNIFSFPLLREREREREGRREGEERKQDSQFEHFEMFSDIKKSKYYLNNKLTKETLNIQKTKNSK